jgi:hypothetical protein
MAGRIILNFLKAAPKILRYERRFGTEAADKMFSPLRVRAAKDSAEPFTYRGEVYQGTSRDKDAAIGLDKKATKLYMKKLFNKDYGKFSPNSGDSIKVGKKLEEMGEKVMYRNGGIVDMTKDKKYYKGIL